MVVHFLPKSAGISPQALVSHFTILVSYSVLFLTTFRPVAIKFKQCFILLVLFSFVLHFFFFTQPMAIRLSRIDMRSLPFCFKKAKPCTKAKIHLHCWFLVEKGLDETIVYGFGCRLRDIPFCPGFPLDAASTEIEYRLGSPIFFNSSEESVFFFLLPIPL